MPGLSDSECSGRPAPPGMQRAKRVLLVLDRLAGYGAELEYSSHLISSLSLEYDLSIHVVLMSREDWLHGDGPFHLNLREEAIAA